MHAVEPVRRELVSVVTHHQEHLFARALALTGNRSEAADLVQDTLLKGLRSLGGYRSGSNMIAWLMRILVNRFIDCRRRDRCRPWLVPLPEELPWVAQAEPPDELPDPTPEELHRAVAHLPAYLGQTYRLRVVDGLSYQQISHALAVPVRTVGTRLRRARQHLRRSLFQGAFAGGDVNDSRASPRW